MTATVRPEALAAALGLPEPTPEQAAVIAAPLQAALVVAGAGSGKTETMAARVVWLVAGGHVARHEVLGLTFTRKAAGELSERIGRRLHRLAEFEARGLVPHLNALWDAGELAVFRDLEDSGAPESERRRALDERARRVGAAPSDAETADAFWDRPTVTTYNAFADTLVRENAVRAGRDADVAILSESAAWLLMRRVVLDSDDARLAERGASLGTLVDAALRVARDGVDNEVDLDELRDFPVAFASLLERPSTSGRVSVYKEVADAVHAVSGLDVLADLAREYGERKRRGGVIDFADQVADACRLLREHPALGDELRARYRVVLLDEYQDTSVLQTRMLSAAFRGSAVMAVGDPHQSIYGWRGASAGNLGDFLRVFGAGGQTSSFSLMTSWRNSVAVLDAATAVLEPLTENAPVAVGQLRPRPGAPQGEVRIEVAEHIDDEAERVALWFEQVRARRRAAGQTTTGAVLFRSKRHMSLFAAALGRRGIPHRILGLGGLLSAPEVTDVVAALRVIGDPTAGSALLRLLSGPRWAVGVADLHALHELARRLGRHDHAQQPLTPEVRARLRASAEADPVSLVDAVDFIARQKGSHGWFEDFTPAARERLREAGEVFANLRRQASLPVTELVRVIERELRLDIELAANEARGPVRLAGAQLRAFESELEGFVAADPHGSLPSLLAWLEHAERRDDVALHSEPVEADVVQLLTIHGSKGLEWDAVAVVRMVTDELPARGHGFRGWLSFGQLPAFLRGDAPWLPHLRWEEHLSPTQQDLKAALADYTEEVRARHLEEERRLAYVALTRAREHLLLTASPWAGTSSPRPPGAFLRDVAEALDVDLPEQEVTENPFAGRTRTLEWPMDPLGARRPAVEAAAALVEAERARDAATPDPELVLLLAERAERAQAPIEPLPVRIPASRYKDYRDAGGVTRPLPQRPVTQATVGTQFHAWLEKRSGRVSTSSSWDDELLPREADSASAQELEKLKERFLASPWAARAPIAVEIEIDVPMDDLFDNDRTHVVICKIDAVYERDGRVEIVDWKTGRSPRSERERAERMLQVELYRRAYHLRFGVPLEQIDVVLYYVADGTELRG